MKCHGCGGYGHTGYRRGRPVPCRKCGSTGKVAAVHPQRYTPNSLYERENEALALFERKGFLSMTCLVEIRAARGALRPDYRALIP